MFAKRTEQVYPHYSRTSLDLLVLCALRYLGRVWTLPDIEEATAINRETIRLFLHKFIEFGSTLLYSKHVTIPTTEEELQDCEVEYHKAGFPGCIGSSDATHIVMEKCKYSLRQLHLGYKLTHTARTYNITVNHRRRILSSTKGHPARFNDKTLCLFDDFINRLKTGAYDSKFHFDLFDYAENGETKVVKYAGCYLIVDNGYLPLSVIIPPMTTTSSRSEIRFSEWLESLRKDVECTFGILKSRWRMLKYGIRLQSIIKCDQVWLTCCALRNRLLEVDGMATNWKEGVLSTWDTENDVVQLPFAVEKLLYPGLSRKFDLSGMGYGDDVEQEEVNGCDDILIENDPMIDNEDRILVSSLTMNQFRKCLIRHFNIVFHQQKVVWPKRLK